MWLSLSSLPTAFYFVHSQSFPKQIFINTIISDYRLSWSFTASPPLQFLGFTCHYAHVAWESRLRDMIAWMSWTSSAMEEIQAHWMEEIQAHWSDPQFEWNGGGTKHNWRVHHGNIFRDVHNDMRTRGEEEAYTNVNILHISIILSETGENVEQGDNILPCLWSRIWLDCEPPRFLTSALAELWETRKRWKLMQRFGLHCLTWNR